MAGKFGEAMTEPNAEQYRRAKIALLTGWTFDYIDQLGAADESLILEVHEAEQSLRSK